MEPFPVTARIKPLAEGVWYLADAFWLGVAAEFDKQLVVIEAPSSHDRSLKVIDRLEQTIPGKPVGYLVNTRHHFDHSAGIRTYAARGRRRFQPTSTRNWQLDLRVS